jgi:hypothetical protein
LASINFKVSNQWVSPAGLKVKQNGQWVDAQGQVKVNGQWVSFTNNKIDFLAQTTTVNLDIVYYNVINNYMYYAQTGTGSKTDMNFLRKDVLSGTISYTTEVTGVNNGGNFSLYNIGTNGTYIIGKGYDYLYKYNASTGAYITEKQNTSLPAISTNTPIPIGTNKFYLGASIYNISDLSLYSSMPITPSNVYTSSTTDDIVAREGSSGNIYYLNNYGTNIKWSTSSASQVVFKGGFVYLTRKVENADKTQDLFLYKYDSNGILLFSKLVVTFPDYGEGNIAVGDAQEVFVLTTSGQTGQTDNDAVHRYDASGKREYMIYLRDKAEIFELEEMEYYNGTLEIRHNEVFMTYTDDMHVTTFNNI